MTVELCSLFVAGFVTILQSFFFLRVNRSLFFTPLIINQAVLSISFVTIYEVYSAGYMNFNEFVFLFISLLSFAFLLPLLVAFFPINVSVVFSKEKISKLDYQVIGSVVLICVLLNSFYNYRLWTSFDDGDSRLLLNREIRAISILKDFFTIWALSGVSYLYANFRRYRYLSQFAVISLLVSFSGSKASLLVSFMIFIFFFLNFNVVSKMLNAVILTLSVMFLFLPAYLVYGDVFIDKIVNRIFMSGDIYTISFVEGEYSLLFGLYDVLPYLFHPFTSLAGVRGYDHPFGAQVVETAGHDVTGMGPNPHLGILSVVLSDGNYQFSALLFSAILAMVVVSWLVIRHVIKRYYLGLSFRIFIFTSYYMSLYLVFIDIGAAQFALVYMLLAVLVWLAFKFLADVCRTKNLDK